MEKPVLLPCIAMLSAIVESLRRQGKDRTGHWPGLLSDAYPRLHQEIQDIRNQMAELENRNVELKRALTEMISWCDKDEGN